MGYGPYIVPWLYLSLDCDLDFIAEELLSYTVLLFQFVAVAE